MGILRAVRNDAVALVRRRRRAFSHSTDGVPARDPQILQVVGEIAADAFAGEAIVPAAAAEAKVAIDSFAQRTAGALFDAGGASASQSSYNLDRHWRKIRTISTHNPTFLKASAVGDHLVNGMQPPRNGFF